jgi:ABC-type transport system substrate-binding protein
MKKLFIILATILCTGSYCVGLFPAPITAAEEPQYGGTLTFNMFPPPSILGNPLKFRGPDHEYIDNTLQTLIRPSNEKMGEFEPLLAESWERAPDKSYYIFKLRKGVKFHDGTDFNAQAVKWNLDQWVNSPRARLDKVESIEIIDDYTIKFNLKSWEAIFLSDLAKDTYIISPSAFQKHDEKWVDTHPVGTGPFKLKEFKRNIVVSLERFDGYWKKGLPYLDEIKILIIPDPMVFSASFQRKELDAVRVDYILATELGKTGKYETIALPTGHDVLYFNSQDPKSIWSRKKAREALEYAIDKEAIAKVITKGFGYPIYEIVHSINKVPPGPGTRPRKYNPEMARQLLKEAGFPEGDKITLTYSTTGPTGVSQDYVAILMQYLKDIGIDTVPNGISFPAFVQKEAGPPLPNEILLSGQRGGPNELLISLDETLGPGSVFFQGISKPEGFYDLLNKALQSEDKKRQMEYLYETERVAYGDAIFIPIISEAFITVQHPYVENAVWFWGSSPYPNLEGAWIDQGNK